EPVVVAAGDVGVVLVGAAALVPFVVVIDLGPFGREGAAGELAGAGEEQGGLAGESGEEALFGAVVGDHPARVEHDPTHVPGQQGAQDDRRVDRGAVRG